MQELYVLRQECDPAHESSEIRVQHVQQMAKQCAADTQATRVFWMDFSQRLPHQQSDLGRITMIVLEACWARDPPQQVLGLKARLLVNVM